MKVSDLYAQAPRQRHSEIVISGDRLYFDGEEYAISGEGELSLIRSPKNLEQKIDELKTAVESKSLQP